MVAFVEKATSRRFGQDTDRQRMRLEWWASGETDETAVRAALLSLMPTSFDGLTLTGWDADTERESGATGQWDCWAEYAFANELAGGVKTNTVPGPTDPLGNDWGFDLTAKQAHITQSLLTVTSRFDSTKGGRGAPAWATSTPYAVGQEITNSGNLYTCTVAGTSASSGGGPTGGGTYTDGTVTWQYVSAAPTPVTSWAASTAYSSGAQVDNNGFLYQANSSGTSGTSGGPIGTGSSISDGTLTWKYVSPDLDPGAPSYGGAIGVTKDQIAGTDVYVGNLEFTKVSQVYPMTLALLETLLNLVGAINQSTYFNFPPKTLMYLGCAGSCKPGNIWTLAHRFAANPSRSNIKVGPNITIPFKAGFDYLWAMYADAKVQVASGKSFLIQQPVAAFVEQVSPALDFSALPIS
jgi:hypothetical protein